MGSDSSTKNVILLDGYSGYRVTISKTNSHYTVVKKATDPSKNERLRKQYEKHVFFQQLEGKCFGVPKIVRSGFDGGLFFYEYEFVEGVTLMAYIDRGSRDDLIPVLDKLVRILKYMVANAETYYEKDSEGTLSDFLRKKIRDNSLQCGLDKGLEAVLEARASQISPKTRSLCHGDFTFDNIIVDEKGKLWLIDYLDVFPHYWMDISKLFQDIDGDWYEIKHKIQLPRNKLLFIRSYLLSEISRMDADYSKFHNFMLAIVFLRILPYAKSGEDRERILEKVKFFAGKN